MTPQNESPATPTFSVVMPAYNTAATIGAAAKSVLAQSLDDFELIVADDGSLDDTVAQARLLWDPRIRVLELEHRGAAAARNSGINHARGRIVSFIDSDDLWMPHYLESMKHALDENPDAGFAYTDAWVMGAHNGRIRRSTITRQPLSDLPPVDPDQFLARLIQTNFIFTSVSAPRTVLEQVGGFDESLTAVIDWDLWLRIAARKKRGVRASGLLAVYRAGRPGSISSSRRRVVVNLITMYGKLAEDRDISPSNRALARERLARFNRELGALDRTLPVSFVLYHARSVMARLKHGLLRTDSWYRDAPAEVAEAFPALFSERSDS